MTLAELKDKYQSAVRNWTVENLKADRDFMQLCRDDEGFRLWVLDERPDMANEKPPRVKFLGLAGNTEPLAEKSPDAAPMAPVEVEEISNFEQIVKDLKAFRKTFIK